MTAYYNEIDPYAAQWLRNLIAAGHIAPGIVDERSIEDVTPYDLKEFTQCHFFAGIGVWSYALRRAGWADNRPIWTGSCPCQPFSSAGKGAGFADERHLWPAFNHLIRECRPTTVIGEQVASKDSEPWLDLVQADLEALGYAFGAIPFPSAGIGAPHIRDRLYWVANTQSDGHFQRKLRNKNGAQCSAYSTGQDQRRWESRFTSGGEFSELADTEREGLEGGEWGRAAGAQGASSGHTAECDSACGLADAESTRFQTRGRDAVGIGKSQTGLSAPHGGEFGRLADTDNGTAPTLTGIYERARPIAGRSGAATGPTNGFWRAADWLLCRDGKWRPVEPGTFPLAHGAPARVGRLRAYGNAINAEAARIFIESMM